MRRIVHPDVNKYRLRNGMFATRDIDGNIGMFLIPGPLGRDLTVMASDASEWPFDKPAWEHVSVSTPKRTPHWDEMCFIKNLFWDKEETVIQLHPPESVYVNNHPHVLHLWKPVEIELPLPPASTVGDKNLGTIYPEKTNE